MQFSWKNYTAPTPKTLKRLADAALAGAMTVSTISFANDYKTVAVVVLIVAGVAKLLSNFFADDETPPAA